MPYSAKKHVQYLTEILIQYGVEDVIISPGSRNGALTMHFAQHPKINCHSIVDERSAGFVALGMALNQKKPVAVCCTSGSATVNYYPAIVEAFYQNIPIIIISADRPTELVDQFDGQTIRQYGVFEKHIKHNIQIENFDTKISEQNDIEVQKALTACISESTPIHINVPVEEPIYETVESYNCEITLHKNRVNKKEYINYKTLSEKWNQSKRKLILVGMHAPNKKLEEQISSLSEDSSVTVLTETTSNIKNLSFIGKIDQTITNLSVNQIKDLQPEILLTIGQNVISKRIKRFLRNSELKEHWHIDQYWQPNTYFALNQKIQINPIAFFDDFIPTIKHQKSNYFNVWNSIKKQRELKHKEFLQKAEFSDLKVYECLSKHLPEDSVIHFANSSPIRYAQLFDFNQKMYCNRGTSGIDGSISTAVGFAMKSNKRNIIITGDIGFFYDSNALWNNNFPKNLKIILVNNGGGNIFKIIPGPEKTNALGEFFETKHNLTAKNLCEMYNIKYIYSETNDLLKKGLGRLLSEKQTILLEVNTSKVKNEEVLKEYFSEISD